MKVRRDTNGVHLFDRWSGLNILFDEITVPVEQRDPAPRFVSMALTNLCDLRCDFCYAPKHRAILDTQSVTSWAMQLDEGGCMGIGFGGGEPTLHPDFVSLCQYVTAQTQMAVSFTTHGHRLTENIAEQLVNTVHFVRVSMDGVGKTYERIRRRSFAALIEKLALVRSIAPFGVNYVVNSETIRDLDSAATIAFAQGAFEMLLLPERSVAGIGGFDQATQETLTEWIRRNSLYRLAISDSPPIGGLPFAEPFSDVDQLSAYAHIDASRQLLTSSFSLDGVEVRSSVVEAVRRLREQIGGTK